MNNYCLCCGEIVPEMPKRLVGRHGKTRQYCSTICVKKAWALANKDKIGLSRQKWIEQNPEKRKESSSMYMKRNRPYYTEYSTLRARKVQKAQPIWADTNSILDVYKEAAYLGLEVDHIIPLTHKLVCGLHVWENLQLLSRKENAQKSNKFIV